MSHSDYSANPDDYLSAGQPPVTRRTVLRTVAGAGAAGLVATAALGATARTALAATRQAGPVGAPAHPGPHRAVPRASQPGPRQAIVVHVRDVAAGEMDIFAGTSQTRLRDQALAAALAQAIR